MANDSDELARLADLHQRGALSDDEFTQAKARVLNGVARDRAEAAPVVNAINNLRRSRHDRWIGGVCGGLAALTGLAAWAWRLGLLLLALLGGTGVLMYGLMWLLIPVDELLTTPER
jgi:phage shock protein C